jgi:tetratricopeptide (TPR) repeat protein
MKKRAVLLPLVLLLTFVVLLGSCNKEQKRILNRLLVTEDGDYSGEELDEKRVEELEAHVREYGKKVQELVEQTGKLGIYYKMLALEYLDNEMYGPAAENFLKSLKIYPNNPSVQYYTGLAMAQLSGAGGSSAERRDLLEEAAFHYRRAVELKPDYFNALYALSVLLIFELERPFEAEEFVLRALDEKSGDEKSLFLLARIRVLQNRFDEAIEIYDQIIENSSSSEVRSQAKANREQLIGGGYNG